VLKIFSNLENGGCAALGFHVISKPWKIMAADFPRLGKVFVKVSKAWKVRRKD
jgi:hypothetical protein